MFKLPSLPPALREDVERYHEALAEAREYESRARGARKIAGEALARITGAMGRARKALLGNRVVVRTLTPPVPASIKLAGGRVVAWAEVECVVLKSGERVERAGVASLYGGRAGSEGLEIG